MSGRNKSSSPGYVGRAIAEAKKLKQAAEAQKLLNEAAEALLDVQKQTTTKTTEIPKAKKVTAKQGAVAVEKASTKRARQVANQDKTDSRMGNEKPTSTRTAINSITRRSPIKRNLVTYFPHIT
jgi:hypothetical protein